MKRIILSLACLASPVAADEVPPPVDVYVIAGQSNALGIVGPTPASLLEPLPNTYHYWVNTGTVSTGTIPLQTLSGIAPGAHFGVELSFVRSLQSDREVAIAKVAWNGSGSVAWLPSSNNLFTLMQQQVNEALSEIPGGRVAGFLWLQGEADATTEWSADRYSTRLRSIIAGVRNAYGDIPFLYNQLHQEVGLWGYPYRDKIRSAQLAVAMDENATMIVGDDLALHTDYLHFSPSMMQTMGERFASALNNPADRNYDGVIDGSDFLLWQTQDGSQDSLGQWSDAYQPAAISAVPEPSTILMSLATIPLFLLRKGYDCVNQRRPRR